MAAFDFPASPTVGQTYTPAGGPTYSWNGYAWVVVNSNGGFAQQTFTATAGQTLFAPTNVYTPGLLDVFHNGVKLVSGIDYTATDGLTFTLAYGAAAGDAVQCIAYAAVSGANVYTKAEANARFEGSAFIAYASATQSIPNNTPTKLAFNVEDYDADGSYDPVLYRFTPKVPGLYLITAACSIPNGMYVSTNIYKNGSIYASSNIGAGASQPYATETVALVRMNGTTDYVEALAYQALGSTISNTISPGTAFFSGAMIRGA